MTASPKVRETRSEASTDIKKETQKQAERSDALFHSVSQVILSGEEQRQVFIFFFSSLFFSLLLLPSVCADGVAKPGDKSLGPSSRER